MVSESVIVARLLRVLWVSVSEGVQGFESVSVARVFCFRVRMARACLSCVRLAEWLGF